MKSKKLFLLVFSTIMILTLFITNCRKDDYIPIGNNNNNRDNLNNNNDTINDTINNDTNDVDPFDTLVWTQAEIDLITSGGDSTLMELYIIDNYSDSLVLRDYNSKVLADSTDTILVWLINRMKQTVLDPTNTGVGIAAPQVGINRRIIWVQRQDKAGDPYEVYLNPEIIQVSAAITNAGEGCLSIPNPNISGAIQRFYGLHVGYERLDGTDTTELILHNYVSRVFQHEIDHLNGILYIDYIDTTKSSDGWKRKENFYKDKIGNIHIPETDIVK